jgi:signal transduction histidine kinase
MPFTSLSQSSHVLRTSAGQPVEEADLPILAAWRNGRAVEAEYILSGPGRPECRVTWSAVPHRDATGQVVGVIASVCSTPPDPDWLALSGLAHDLRTPLQTIRLLLAVPNEPPLASDELRQFTDRLRSASERALQIGRDLLEWCRAPFQSSRRVKTSWFALEPFLLELAVELIPAAEGKGLRVLSHLQAARGLEVQTDRVRLGRLLANLLGNAVRYTNHGQIELTVDWRGEGEERELVLGVIDTGSGIAVEERESVFQPYERGQAGRGDDSGGSGLGLAVVDRLTEELGLRLEMHSEADRGTAFCILLPARVLRPVAGSE